MGAARRSRCARRHGDSFRKARLLPRRRARRRLFDGVFQPQASGRGPVLSDDHRGQGGEAFRRRQHLSPERPGERAGQALLVGDGLRPRDARAHPRPEVGQPLLANVRACKRTPTARWTSISDRRLRRERSRIGCPRAPSGKFEVLFRLYGPEKPLFDKTWKLPDIERSDAQ